MDQQKFLQLLQSIQIPNTGTLKAATAELRKTYYPHPESLIWLLQILTSHESAEVRQQAAVEALRLVPRHWSAVPEDQKPMVREKLLQSSLEEEKTLVRHSIARVIAAIAGIDLNDGEWETLPGLLVQACNSNKAAHREVGVYIFFALLESVGGEFYDKIPGLFSIFQKTIKDPESAEVRINTMLCLGTLGMLMDSDDEQNVARFVEAFPAMVAVLKDAVHSEDEERSAQAFEVFQNLLSCDPVLMNTHFKDLLNFMIDLAVNKSLSDDSRSQALSFLMQCAKYRKMKILATKDMGENLTRKCLQIATEIDDDDDDDDDDVSPHKSALGLLDLLASGLPPRQVIVPLLDALPQYVNSPNPAFRQAGILAVGMCVEGAPDFISTQLDVLMPVVFKLLNDPVAKVRYAALNGVARLADDLGDELSKYHEQLIPALLKNLDASSQASNEAEPKTLAFLKASCGALDSVTDGMDKQTLASYISELIPRLGRLLNHPDFSVKASAAGAIGSIAGSAEDSFMPYFESTMKAMSSYVEMKASEEELDLRGTVCDAMGSIATAVGPAAFQPYVQPLMHASEEALHLGHPRLKETSYILWSILAKVYEEEFTPFLEGVMKGLMDCLLQEESDLEVELGEEAKDLVGKEVMIGGKKVKVAAPKSDEIEDLDEMGDDDDEDDWDDFGTVTAVAMEKEIAVEVIGDVLSHTRKNFVPYFEKTIETVVGLVEHTYEGVRKAAIGTLWRAYACLWALMEDHTGEKWSPGLPLKSTPSGELLKLGEVVVTATLSVWEDEMDRAVVTDINRNVAATLKLCGPAILTQPKFVDQTTSIIGSIITRSHICQQDPMEDEPQEDVEDQESSEYDWLVIDTALDVVIGLSAALGDQFVELFKVFQKPIMKFASSPTNYERSTAIGTIAECTAHMGAAVTPFTSQLLKLHIHRLTDEDPETKSNAAYAVGLLISHSTDSTTYLKSYNTILSKLEPLLQTQRARTLDNACGCVCRMVMAHQDKVPIGDILPALVNLLPLKEDYEENKPIFDCITGLYQQENNTIIELTPKLLEVFTHVLGEPEEQLEADTRAKIKETVKFIAQKNASLVTGNQKLITLMRE